MGGKVTRCWMLLAAITICGHGQNTAPENSVPLDRQSYIRTLDEWIANLESPSPEKKIGELPSEWVASTDRGEYRVRTDFVRRAAVPLRDEDDVKAALERLKALRDAAEIMDRQGRASTANPRETADRILSGREYRRVRTPGLEDSLRDRINEALLKLVTAIFSRAPSGRTLGNVVLWGLLLLALVGLFYWARKLLRADYDVAFGFGAASAGETISAKPWRVWLRESEAEARNGNFRQAVRLAYWAGISAMEESGAWKPDRARTPREYMRLLSRNSSQSPVLTELTRDFERIWYAQQQANSDDYAASLKRVQELGCR